MRQRIPPARGLSRRGRRGLQRQGHRDAVDGFRADAVEGGDELFDPPGKAVIGHERERGDRDAGRQRPERRGDRRPPGRAGGRAVARPGCSATRVPSRPSKGVNAATRRSVPTFRRNRSASTPMRQPGGAFEIAHRPPPALHRRQRDARRGAGVQFAIVERLAATEFAVVEPFEEPGLEFPGHDPGAVGAAPSVPSERRTPAQPPP